MAKTTAAVLTLTSKEIIEFVLNCIRTKDVPLIAGPGGIGKSQTIAQAFKKANLKMIDIRLSQYLSEDLSGLPERNGDKATYLPFDLFPLEGDPIPDGYDGWGVLLDELPSASEEVLAAAYSLILDRTVGGKKLHSRCAVVAAGNRASDSAIARELPDTLITRMLPVTMEVNPKVWIEWAKKSPNRNDGVIAFIEKNPNMLYAPTPKESREENETYSQPRGWEKVMKQVNLHEKLNCKETEQVDAAGIPTGVKEKSIKPLTKPIYYMALASVGSLAGKAFKDDYEESLSLPNPWEIAQSPHSSKIPSSIASQVKLMKNLADYWISSNEQTRDNVLTYVNRVGGDMSVMFSNQIKSKLGSSSSDKELLNNIEKRLGIDPLLGTASKKKEGEPLF